MTNRIKELIRRGFVVRDNTVKTLSLKYIEKARFNLTTMSLLSDLNLNKKAREILNVPSGYDSDEWIVTCGYYAMYSSALALLAKIGFRSKNHAATIIILEEYFLKKKMLDGLSLSLLKNASFQKEELEKLSEARHKREIAQYSVTKKTTREIAKKIKEDAYSFVNKIESIIKS